MISHKHKCIFIHIAKCAGTSIEHAFGVDVMNGSNQNELLFGWDETNKLWLQHATPQQLFDKNLVSKDQWDNYYKFIIYRNSWDRAYSDYKWMKNVRNVSDSFTNFLKKRGKYKKILNDSSTKFYAGDHLYLQKDYFFLNNERIIYDSEINFDNLQTGLYKLIKDLGLENSFFNKKLNVSKENKKLHYSLFYNKQRKNLVSEIYKEDITFFNFKFDDKRNFINKVIANLKY